MRRMPHDFFSDHCAGATPEAFAALQAANQGRVPSYGDDDVTRRAAEAVRALFDGLDCDVFFVFTGTAANALSLAALSPPFGVVACTAPAHVVVDECGAPGFFGGGLQLRALPSADGKLDARAFRQWASFVDVHSGRPAAVTLSQSTELGTVYGLGELAAIGDAAREHGVRVHVDGARFANAVASLGCRPRDIVESAGVGVLSLGGTKNGLVGSEAIVSFDRAASAELPFRRKQAGQLGSKHRFLAAPWIGALEGGAFFDRARHANTMAARLASGLLARGVALAYPREANAVFVRLDASQLARLHACGYAPFTEESWHGAYRFVCSWDTTAEDVDALVTAFEPGDS
jgi:threonine aldolase